MVLKTAKRGPNAGGQFWGCSKWTPRGKHSLWAYSTDVSADHSSAAGTTVDADVSTSTHSNHRNESPNMVMSTPHSDDGMRAKVLWTDAADQRDAWISRYTPAGSRLRTLPADLVSDVERDLGACWIATSDVDSYMPADAATQRVLAMARKIAQRGTLPFVDPRIERELLVQCGHELAKSAEGLLTPRLVEALDSESLRSHLGYARSARIDPRVSLGSKEEEALSEVIAAGGVLGRYLYAQAPLELLSTGLGRDESGSRRVDFFFSHPSQLCVVEIDGAQHSGDGADVDRDELLAAVGVPAHRISAAQANEGKLPPVLEDLSDLPRSGEFHPIIHGPIQISRLFLALIEAVRRGFLAGDTWVIDLEDETGLALTGFAYSLNLLHAIDRLWGQRFSPAVVQVKQDGQTVAWRRVGSYYEQITADAQPTDVRIYLDLGLGALHELPDHEGLPAVVVRDAPLPIRVRDSYGEPTVRTVPTASDHALDEPLRELLRSVFAMENFREGQLEAIKEVVQGRDCVVLLPTGAGKSLVYQMAGIVLPGRTLVVDPLVSLMEDQVRSLHDNSIDRVIAISGFTTQSGQRERALQQVQSGDALFVFVSPERLQSPQFRESLRVLAASTPINLAVIDEAHCVSEWGHDFRTSYLNVGPTLRRFGADANHHPPPLLALTGTASRAVLKDVLNDLDIVQRSAHTLIKPRSFDRPELRYEVYVTEPSSAKATLVGILQGMPDYFGISASTFFQPKSRRIKPGLVFVPHANGDHGVSAIADAIQAITGSEVLRYSGSAPKHTDKGSWEYRKREAAHRFMNDDVPVMVTTKAFGMGIDKPNIRFVVHYGVPSSIEAYYQEVGRAGRDRMPARCVLLVSELDASRTSRLLGEATDLQQLHAHVDQRGRPQDSDDLDRQLFFFTRSFRGEESEIQAVIEVLEELDPLGEAHIAALGFGTTDQERERREKALHRLVLLGAVSDYTKDWSARRFDVTVSEASPDTVAESLVRFVERSQPGRSSGMRDRISQAARGKTRDAIEHGTRLITEFIYETVAAARRRSLREMILAARETRGDENRFRQRILNYLQEGDVAPVIEALTDAPEFSLSSWISALQDIATMDESQEWRGSTARLLASYPEQPGLLIGRGYSELLLPDGDTAEGLRNLSAGFKSALRSYNASFEEVADGLSRLMRMRLQAGEFEHALGLQLIAEEVVGKDSAGTMRKDLKQAHPTMTALAVLELGSDLQSMLTFCDEVFERELM